MRLESILFGDSKAYARMAKVFQYTAQLNSPNTPLTLHHLKCDDHKLIEIATSEFVDAHEAWVDNARKTKHHCNIVQNAKNGDEICLIDCDTFILHDLSEIQNYDFDIMLTSRRGMSRYPFNSGVVFVRVNEKTKEWYRQWYKNVKELMVDKKLMNKFHRAYGGINQSALGMLLRSDHYLKVKNVPCWIWNCASDVHGYFDIRKTKVVHVNGQLRHVLVHNASQGSEVVMKLASIWRGYEQRLDAESISGKTTAAGSLA